MDAFVKLMYDHAGFFAIPPEAAALAAFAAVLVGRAAPSYARTMYSPG